MPLRHFRKQDKQLLQFERGRIIGTMEAGWSARRVARQLGGSDCVVRIQEMSFTQRARSRLPRKISRNEDHSIVINARVQPTASSAAIQVQVSPSVEDHVSSRTIRRRLAELNLGSRRPLRVLPLTLTYRRLR
ncbi:HTH_Tnp_Tc3_2 domain-containing protein [Trichonephila clavipes]|nr:HTH_Tnp_Tc3_2 domain-containing protein [Trichonephila clavipes]